MNSALTQAQQDAMEKIAILMREHFLAGIAVVSVETEDGQFEQTFHTMHGGMTRGIGLLEMGKMSIYRGIGTVRPDQRE